jgi:thiamine-phosphate pyrophosphorylase
MPVPWLTPLYPILDVRFLPQPSREREQFLERTAKAFSELGIALMQLRSKGTTQAETRRDACNLRAADAAGLRLILNDDPVLAHELGYDGAHLGQQDMPLVEARQLLGPDAVIGLSTHSSSQVRAANATTADYIAIGPVFSTTTKPDAEEIVGLEGVRAARALTGKPLVAIGGISLENAASVRDAGADSIAVISALFGHPSHSPAKLAEDFLRRLR